MSERPLYDSLVSFGTPYENTLPSLLSTWQKLFSTAREMSDARVRQRLTYVTSPPADAGFSLSFRSTWDFAAAALILTEAGGKITAIDGKQLPSSDGRKSSVLAGGERALADFASAGLADIIKDTFSDSCKN